MRKFRIPLFFIATSTILSCGFSFKSETTSRDVRDDVAATANANKEAKTYNDWHASEFNSEKVFSQWAEKVITKDLKEDVLCQELLATPEDQLALFENEIKSEKTQFAVQPCLRDLKEKIEIYWQNQRAQLKEQEKLADGQNGSHTFVEQSITSPISTDVRFPDPVVVLRDVSDGYFAVTGDLPRKQVLLTFDDGPSGLYTQQILSILKKANVRALFFALGQQVHAYPHLVEAVAKDGHSIGSHSTTHRCLPTKSLCKKSNGGKILTYEEAIADLKGGHQAVYDVLGWVDPFIRFPYGESSPELKSFLQKNGIGEFYWNVDSEDWMASHSVADVVALVMKQLDERGRGIILFHDIQRKTAEGLPTILKRLYQAGYQPVIVQATDSKARFNSKIVDLKKPRP